jgi:hypothetical protein
VNPSCHYLLPDRQDLGLVLLPNRAARESRTHNEIS